MTNKISVNIVLDRSGSMASVTDNTIEGFNAYLAELRKDDKTEYSVSLSMFDSEQTGPEAKPRILIPYKAKPLSEVPPLDRNSYVPEGWTPLYDAIGKTIREVENEVNGVPILLVVVTDGMENSSREFTRESVKELIKNKEADGWTFVFMGANIDSYAVSGSVGMAAFNTTNYNQGQERAAFMNLASATASYAEKRALTCSLSQVPGETFWPVTKPGSIPINKPQSGEKQTPPKYGRSSGGIKGQHRTIPGINR